MWVVNPSEEEEKGLINLKDMVPGATSGGQLPLEVWLPGATPTRGPAEWCGPKGQGNEGFWHRGTPIATILKSHFSLYFEETSKGCDLCSSLQGTAQLDPSVSVAFILSCPSTPPSLP